MLSNGLDCAVNGITRRIMESCRQDGEKTRRKKKENNIDEATQYRLKWADGAHFENRAGRKTGQRFVLMRYATLVVIVAATKEDRGAGGIDFLPLMVDYQEMS